MRFLLLIATFIAATQVQAAPQPCVEGQVIFGEEVNLYIGRSSRNQNELALLEAWTKTHGVHYTYRNGFITFQHRFLCKDGLYHLETEEIYNILSDPRIY